MVAHSGRTLSLRLIFSALVAALFLVPGVSQAQTGNTATGTNALNADTTGSYNTADGYYALQATTTGNNNTGSGYQALYANTTGYSNTADGYSALFNNTTGYYNTASGYSALSSNTTGASNTAYGVGSLLSNSTGNFNSATGVYALYSNTTGVYNTAGGYQALLNNTTGGLNTATGTNTLYKNTTGYNNTANGTNVLYANTKGYNNTADGYVALFSNTTGANNTADGVLALYSNTTGANNIALGYGAGQNIIASNNIAIGNNGQSADSGVIRIGTSGTHSATYIAGINGATAANGVAVYVDSNGKLGTLTSSARFKYDIHSIGDKSDKLMNLRPVSFRYKEAISDGSHPQQYGLIAEEVAKVYPDLVQYDKQGKPFTVYYQLLTPMMLNELQKAHHHTEAQDTEIEALKAALQTQNAALQAQSAMLKTQGAELTALKQAQQGKGVATGQGQQPLRGLATLVLAGSILAGFVLSARLRPSR